MKEMISSVEVVGNNADEFLQYINDNYDMLVNSLKKNGTFSEEIVQQTIIKCYDNIVKNNKIIKSHKDFFFWCCRNNFWCATNKQRKLDQKFLTNFFENDTEEHFNEDINVRDYLQYLIDNNENKEAYRQGIDDLFLFICEKIEQEFTSKEAMIWILYTKLKSQGKLTYQQLSDIIGLSNGIISNTINKINKYVQNDEEIIKMKNKLYDVD